MNTLRGIFPEPPPVPRRNFIKENMLHIKRMQGYIVNDSGDHISYRKQNKQLENDATQKTMKLIQSTKKKLNTLSQLASGTQKTMPTNSKVTNKSSFDTYSRTGVETYTYSNGKRFKETGVQTEVSARTCEPKPSLKPTAAVTAKGQNLGDGDRTKRRSVFSDDETSKKDWVKENASVRPHSRGAASADPTKAPTTYQRGVVPKYLRERKEELFRQTSAPPADDRCPDGHVVLPEHERKETLRMLRQSYSELVAELNQLPVRSDTLKIRNRKVEIENQLKKLDEGIKVFTRPKVYVKIGA